MVDNVFELPEKDFFSVINTRKTIRKYTDKIPPIEAIKIIADAGRQAPSATNSQNWEFIAILDQQTKLNMAQSVEQKFNELLLKIKDDTDKSKLNGYKYYSMFFTQPPVIFAIVEKHRASTMLTILENNGMSKEELKQYDNRSSILSIGAAIENMSLTATALGLATCWMCAPLVAYKELGNLLNIEKGDRVASLLTLGYPENENTSRPPKKTLDEVFRII